MLSLSVLSYSFGNGNESGKQQAISERSYPLGFQLMQKLVEKVRGGATKEGIVEAGSEML